MENYFWSPSTLSFYPESLKPVYEQSGSWPSDAISVTQEERESYTTSDAPEGKVRGAGKNGRPAWVNKPAVSEEDVKRFITKYRDKAWSSEIVSSSSGVLAWCDSESRQRISDKLNYLESRGEDTVIRWKGPDGFVDATAADFQEITIEAEAVRQRAFDAEDAITGREFKTIEEARKAFDAAYAEAG